MLHPQCPGDEDGVDVEQRAAEPGEQQPSPQDRPGDGEEDDGGSAQRRAGRGGEGGPEGGRGERDRAGGGDRQQSRQQQDDCDRNIAPPQRLRSIILVQDLQAGGERDPEDRADPEQIEDCRRPTDSLHGANGQADEAVQRGDQEQSKEKLCPRHRRRARGGPGGHDACARRLQPRRRLRTR
jgi:hypothetical protein